jgi:uncharacterized membrane protein
MKPLKLEPFSHSFGQNSETIEIQIIKTLTTRQESLSQESDTTRNITQNIKSQAKELFGCQDSDIWQINSTKCQQRRADG